MAEHGRCHSFQSHACDERATTPDREHGGVRHTVVGSTYTPVPIGHDAKARIGPVLATSQGVSVQPMACPGRASTIQRHQSDPPSKVRIVFTTGANAIAIAVLIAVILILAAMKSDDFQVERSLVVRGRSAPQSCGRGLAGARKKSVWPLYFPSSGSTSLPQSWVAWPNPSLGHVRFFAVRPGRDAGSHRLAKSTACGREAGVTRRRLGRIHFHDEEIALELEFSGGGSTGSIVQIAEMQREKMQ